MAKMIVVSLLSFMLLPAASPSVTSAAPPAALNFHKVDMISEFPKLHVYAIAGGEAQINGTFLKRVDVGGSSAVIGYFNKTPARKRAAYTRVINAFGFQLGMFADQWVFDSVEPNETTKVDTKFFTVNLDEIFRFTGVAPPSGWEKAAYLVVENMEP